MKLRYKFDLKIQAVYGLIGFVLAAAITYLFGGVDLLVAAVVGIGNFISFGLYTDEKCK